uniref:Uncharacterized protein n=1 Tax=Fagus sylvatica TaxID=28930 RepID=A0A2N9G6K0_FAGSY
MKTILPVKDKHQTPQFKTITARDKEDKKQLKHFGADVYRSISRQIYAHSLSGDSSVVDYYHRFTNLIDTLAAIGQPIPHHEQLSFLLAGLGPKFDSLFTSVKTQLQPVPLEDIYGHLLSHELRLSHNQPFVDLSNASANFVNKPPIKVDVVLVVHHPISLQIRADPTGIIKECYHRFNNSYTMDNTLQMQALLATQQQAVDPNWYPDSGATHHLTHDLANLNVRVDEYSGLEQIRVGNGSGFEASSVARAE